MNQPLVSIILPTYNRSHLIRESIQSVFDQTYKNWELIIVDDGSTDETSVLFTNHPDSRIHYYRIDHCGIIGRVRNPGMRHARGQYIAFLDSDDLWREDKRSEEHTSELQSHSDLVCRLLLEKKKSQPIPFLTMITPLPA